MTAPATIQTISIAADLVTKQGFIDKVTSASPQAWRAADVKIRFCIFSNGVLCDVSNLTSLTLQIKDPNQLGAPALINVTLTSGDLDNTTTVDTWNAGTNQHALFALTNKQMDVILNAAQQSFRIVLSAVTSDIPAQDFPVGIGVFIIVESGDQPPVGAGAAYTEAESDARYPQYALIPLHLAGEAAVSAIFGFFYAEQQIQIVGVQAMIQDAPVGADLTFDLVNGAGVTQTKVSTITAGNNRQRTLFGAPLVVAAGGIIQAKILTVGSTTIGQNLTANLIVKVA